MKRIVLLCGLIFSTLMQGSTFFPHLSLYSLKGEVESLPSGQKELVFVGCQKKACQALTHWYRLFSEHQGKIGSLGVKVVPVFPSFMGNRLLRPPLMALIQQRIPDHLTNHVAVLFSNIEEISSLFNLSCGELEQLQVFLVDENGKILWKASGEPTSQSIPQLKLLASSGR